jgi:hypothetical protein
MYIQTNFTLEVPGLLRCEAVSLRTWFPKFWTNALHSL